MEAAGLYNVVRENLMERTAFEQRSERNAGALWRWMNTVPSTGSSLCKCPEADISLGCPINNKRFSVAGIEGMRRRGKKLRRDRKEGQRTDGNQGPLQRHWAFFCQEMASRGNF